MRRTAFEQFDDQRIAEDVLQGHSLSCAASGCPNRWSVDNGSGRLCSAHAWADRIEWPAITAQQQWEETERARGAHQKPRPAPVDKAEVIRNLLAFAGGRGASKGWAYEMRDREAEGEVLTKAQRDMWRAALRHTMPLECPKTGRQDASEDAKLPTWPDVAKSSPGALK